MVHTSDITVAIATYNRSHILPRVLAGLKVQKEKLGHVIVLDSSDNSETEEIIKDFPGLQYIRRHERTYLPTARNMLLAACKTSIIAFLDDDTIPNPDWSHALAEGFSDQQIAGVTGPTIDSDQNLRPLNKIIRTPRNQNFFTPWGDIYSEGRRWIPPLPTHCSIMQGGNMAFRADLLRLVGGFDEHYIGAGPNAHTFREETDVQVPIIRKGYSFLYHPQALVWHVGGTSGGIHTFDPKSYYYWCGRNHRYFADKYFSPFLSRLSWLTWSKNPPSLLRALIGTIILRKNFLAWHKGLWFGK